MRVAVMAMAAVMMAIGAAQTIGAAQAAGPVSVDPNTVIAGRQAGFDLVYGNISAMKAAIDGGQSVKPYADGAKALAAWASAIPGQFPVGTETGHDTKAKAEIWSDAPGFAKAASDMRDAAEKLAVLAAADDKSGFADQFTAVGKTCGACHRVYRVRHD